MTNPTMYSIVLVSVLAILKSYKTFANVAYTRYSVRGERCRASATRESKDSYIGIEI